MNHASPLTVLRQNVDFRRLFSARLVSLFGDWFNTLAVLALLRELGGVSASAFGWVLILKTLPSIVSAPLAGVAADRYSRRGLLMAADLVRAGIVACMLGLIWVRSVALLYTLVVLQAMVSTFAEPARSALTPDIVAPSELTSANALSAAAWSTMLALGSAAGGMVTAWAGWEVALAVDAATYLASMALIAGIQEPPWERSAGSGVGWRRALGITDVARGLDYLRRRPRVLSLALVKCGWTVAGAITLVLTLLGEQVYPVAGQAMLGVSALYIARGLGTGAGPFLARWISRSEPAAMERLIGAGYLFGAVFYLALSRAGGPLTAALFIFLAHLGGATIWVFSSVRLQQLVPTEVRGRVFAAEAAFFTGMMALSTWVYGRAVDSGAADLTALTAALGCSLLLPAGLWLLRGARLGYAGPEATAEGAMTTAGPSAPAA
jgi:predicted MFS family arabinose efflux permease